MASYDVFTPPEIAAKMRSYLPNHVELLLEPSVGPGNLLRCMDGAYTRADVFDINQYYLDEIEDSPCIRKTCGDFLELEIAERYDAILMNPPYLRYQEMNPTQRTIVRGLSPILRTGNVDLYMAFLVKCLHLLRENGRLVAIVPSSWLYTKSAKLFRDWIFNERHLAALYDYGSTKVFKGIDVYCCIVVLTPTPNTYYTRNDVEVPYDTPSSSATSSFILQDVAVIQNGIATLCDSVFIHDAPLFDEPCWKPILKVSKHRVRSILFPYSETGTILAEDVFRRDNPQTYAYLERNRDRLAARDRGNKKYEAWYAFGRSQGLLVPNATTSVYVSTLCAPSIPTFQHPTMLFYSGIRISPHATQCEKVEQAIAAWKETIVSRSSKRSSNWINLSSSTLRQVPMCLEARRTE